MAVVHAVLQDTIRGKRGRAGRACTLNGERARTSSKVQVGDIIQLVRQQLSYELTVDDIPVRRGPAPEAQACYSESEESIAARESHVADLRSDRLQMATTPGKPDKHTRRQLRNRNRGKV